MKNINKEYNEGLRAGYNKAIQDMAIPIKEWDKLLWSDREWNNIGEEYSSQYKQIMEQLPPTQRYLLFELELIQLKENTRSLELIYKYLRDKQRAGADNER